MGQVGEQGETEGKVEAHSWQRLWFVVGNMGFSLSIKANCQWSFNPNVYIIQFTFSKALSGPPPENGRGQRGYWENKPRARYCQVVLWGRPEGGDLRIQGL